MKPKFSLALMILGIALIIAAAALFLYNNWDENRAAAEAQRLADDLLAQMGEGNYPTPISAEIPMKSIEIDGERYIGVLSIPVLELSLPVIEEWSYPRLKIAPCLYVGSVFNDTLIIAAHNYKKHFGNISILEEGDAVVFTDVDGNAFQYKVVLIETLQTTAIEEMVANDYDLTLFTCTYGGASRVTVRCERVSL